MKIVFISIGVENLAIEFLSSYIKQYDHQTDMVFDPNLFDNEVFKFKSLSKFFDTKKEIAKEVINKKPDLIAFPIFTLNYQRTLQIAKEIKKLNKRIPIIVGGIHPTSVPDVVIKEKNIDIVCVGEGENALVELLDSYSKKIKNTKINNLWFKEKNNIIRNPVRPLIKDLNKLPYPDKDLFNKVYPKFLKDYYTVSSRGCPFNCTYCANNVIQNIYRGLGKPIRQRSPENLINELIIAKTKYHPKQITFADDVFVQDIVWLREFIKLYRKKINLPYTMLTHPSFVSKDVAKLLAKSGCFLLAFGIQSASEKTRTTILKRFETNHQILEAARNCHKAKLNFSIDHIFNIPTEGIKEQEEALSFYNKLRPSIINSYWLQYFPRTEIIKTAVKTGIIKKNMIPKIEKGFTSSSFVVGFGAKDTFNPDLVYTNFQFIFMLLPVLPRSFVDKIIKKKYYNLPFKPPIILNVLIKFMINLSKKRGYVYIDMIKANIYFMFKILVLKLKHLYV